MARKIFCILENKIFSMTNIPDKCCYTVFTQDNKICAVSQLKLGKAAGLDHLTAKCIKNANDALYNQLTFLFTMCCKQGFVSKNFMKVE